LGFAIDTDKLVTGFNIPPDLLSCWDLDPIRSIYVLPPAESSAGENVAFVQTVTGARFVLKRGTIRRNLQSEHGFDDPAKRQAWFALLAALVAGYESVSPLTSVERRALRVMQMSIEVIFIAFYAGIQHPAGVAQNIKAMTWLYANPYEL
jgi:hypothetical protein